MSWLIIAKSLWCPVRMRLELTLLVEAQNCVGVNLGELLARVNRARQSYVFKKRKMIWYVVLRKI